MDREKIITAAELMDMQFLPRSTVVDGMLPAGCYILAGAPKVGKSFLMAQLCWCVATGTPFLGQPTHRSQVLYLSLEDTGERVQGRLIRMFGVEHQVGRLHLQFGTDLRGRDLLAMLEGFFMDHPSVRLVVIDTFQRVREGGGAQYSYQSDYEEIRPFKEFTDIHDVALILVHHTRKNTESENSFDRISGTNGLLGAADGAFLLYREKGRVILDQTGKDLPGQRIILDFDSQRCLWTVVSREAEIAEPPEPLERLRLLDPGLPYRANTLTRKLNALTRRLKEEKGIEYWKSRRPESRQLTLLRMEDEEEDEEHDDDDDDDDSAPAGEIPSLPSSG